LNQLVATIKLMLRLCLREACATAKALAHAVGEARRSVQVPDFYSAENLTVKIIFCSRGVFCLLNFQPSNS
jgi:hypothetical protein